MKLPQRSRSHQIESESVNLIKMTLGSDWIFRNQEDRDYGTDIHLEHFEGERPTGEVLYGQVKGTERELSGAVSLEKFPVKTINYARLFAIPFFLFYTSTKSRNTYFVWLQKYAELKLSTSKLRDNDTLTIFFPERNILDEVGIEKISSIINIEREQRVAITFLSLYARFRKSIDELKSGELAAARRCCECLAKIHMSGAFESELAQPNDISALDAGALMKGLMDIHCADEVEKKLDGLEILLYPLKFKELYYLNMDTTHALRSWINREDAPLLVEK